MLKLKTVYLVCCPYLTPSISLGRAMKLYLRRSVRGKAASLSDANYKHML